MFTHIMVGAKDVDASRRFYDAALGALGTPPGFIGLSGRLTYATSTGIFAVTLPLNGQPATVSNGATIGFAAGSPEQVEAWHTAGLAHGGTLCEDPPGIRDLPMGKMYAAYLRDPAGNKLCAIYRFTD